MVDVIQWETVNDEGAEIVMEIPAKYEVCPRCEGRGTHVNPAIDEHGISPEEFAEDPDFEEAYFSGRYDVACEMCKGLRVILVPDETKADKAILKAYYRHLRDLREIDAIYRAEREMGA